jgi:DNA gyrase subunit A
MTEENDKIKIEKEDKSHQPISSPHSSSDYSRVNSRPRPPTPSDTIREKYEKVEKSEEKEKSRPPSPDRPPQYEKPEKLEKGVIPIEVSEEMKKSYLDYAMSVIVSRAIPSVEDGLKPVQRRILYSMHLMGLRSNTQTKKSARIVGDVIGKYHPHGDVAVYDAMVRMAQDFSLRYPLVFGQGNFGSIDGDPPAAYRYTEAKLEPISEELLQDLDKETVNYVPNFDNSLKEPELLPGKLPSLMLNGASGIAVGMATNIPPHNLNEVCDAIVEYVDDPSVSVEKLTQIIQGPDFPTGGVVQGDMNELYSTGRSKLIMRGKVAGESVNKKDCLIITEIPYMVNKADLMEQIANLIRDKKIKDINDLRDESSKGKIRIVLELRKGVNPKFVINSLYKYTRLQDSFSVNFLALVNGQPKVLSLREVLESYVKYRKKIIIARTKFDLEKAKERQEVVEGLLIALKDIDEVIRLIKKSKTAKEASETLISKYKLTEKQAKAILETKLQQLTSLEVDKLKEEHETLAKKIQEFEKILADVKEVLKIIKKEVKELKDNYGDSRRTQVLKRSISEISEKDIVQDKEVVVTITDKGYVKRMDVKTYKEQKRGGKGMIGNNLATGDFTKQLLTCSTHDYLMFFTTRGRVLWLKTYDIPEAERYGKGKALINLLGLKDENVTKVISVKNFEGSLFMATKMGIVKKISLKHFSKPRASGIKAINLPDNGSDVLIGVELVKEGQEILLSTKKGKAIRFNSNDVRDMGRSSYGVTGIKLDRSDDVVSLEVLETAAILTITKNGYGKRTLVEDYRKTARAGKGVINLKVSEKTGNVVNTVSVNDKDSIIVSTGKGMVIRTNLEHIRVMGRAAQGVRIVKIQQGDEVTDVVRVLENENENGDLIENPQEKP